MRSYPPIGWTRSVASRAFTLIEIMIAVSIVILLLLLAVPSINGVIADRRLRESLDRFTDLVNQAHERSLAEHRSYLIVWLNDAIELRPEAFGKGEEKKPTALLKLGNGDTIQLNLPAALSKETPAEWIFWPSGNCEPAKVQFKGRAGLWIANFSPLNARPQILSYATR